jgi:hypothetical protein
MLLALLLSGAPLGAPVSRLLLLTAVVGVVLVLLLLP